jgi:hypothetical protein
MVVPTMRITAIALVPLQAKQAIGENANGAREAWFEQWWYVDARRACLKRAWLYLDVIG